MHSFLLSEERSFFEAEDAIKNEELLSSYYPDWNREVYREMLKRMNVSYVKNIGSLSKGERIKFQLAFTAAYKPALILMDEPTAGLDPVFREDFLKILQELVAEYETTILIATHIDEDLRKIADYIIEIRDGECIMREVEE